MQAVRALHAADHPCWSFRRCLAFCSILKAEIKLAHVLGRRPRRRLTISQCRENNNLWSSWDPVPTLQNDRFCHGQSLAAICNNGRECAKSRQRDRAPRGDPPCVAPSECLNRPICEVGCRSRLAPAKLPAARTPPRTAPPPGARPRPPAAPRRAAARATSHRGRRCRTARCWRSSRDRSSR